HLAVAPEALRTHRILNVSWRFYADPENDRSNGYAALRRILLALRGGELPDRLGADLLQALADPDDAAAGLLDQLGLVDYDFVPGTNQLLTISEQAPDPASRVTLGEERDALGMPRIRLDWRLGELDRRSLEVAGRLLAEEFGRSGIGRVRLPEWLEEDGWPEDLEAGWHHMGTTRMSDDPRSGVVDRDGRVHGLANLYVAGSSVFPTGGFANPTLTIVALALRLAEHLRA
ncbi:MAG: GMC family oxidoreductase, partial [Geminicoccaceae bacterium]|nr:GMC family oxidoreductase [Geminicoccaceae bacterium]